MAEKIVLSWSGGKDSALTLERLIYHGGYQVDGICTVYNEGSGKVELHNVATSLIKKQAESLNVTLLEIPLPEKSRNEAYEKVHFGLFNQRKELGINSVAFGDI